MATTSGGLSTYVYVDGFNLYYRAVKGTPYKWLNPKALFSSILHSNYEVRLIRYFTADVSGAVDPDAPNRQAAYLRALRTVPEIRIHKGKFLASHRWAALANPPTDVFRPSPAVVNVIRMEEKGSDVNLGSHLLLDSFRNAFDVAVVVSNDTDLVEPIRIAIQELGKTVGLICPAKSSAASLKSAASFCLHIGNRHLAGAQFPDRIPGTNITKPPTW